MEERGRGKQQKRGRRCKWQREALMKLRGRETNWGNKGTRADYMSNGAPGGVGGGKRGVQIYLKQVCKVLHTNEVCKLGQAIQRWHQQRKPLLCICCCQPEPCTPSHMCQLCALQLDCSLNYTDCLEQSWKSARAW